jgi:hypothetical protein
MPGSYYPYVDIEYSDGVKKRITGNPIYVYDYQYTLDEYPNSSCTDKCYRLPVSPSNGAGVSEYRDSDVTGYDWVWPSSGIGTIVLQDQRELEVGLVVDSRTQRVFQINDKNAWEDRVGEYDVGRRIISELNLRAHISPMGEHVEISHKETHVYMKPKDRLNAGGEGYDADGYPLGFRIDITMHKNEKESPEYTQKIEKIQKDGDLVFPEKIVGRSLQQRLKMYSAPWINTGILTDYTVIDKMASPSLRQMQES